MEFGNPARRVRLIALLSCPVLALSACGGGEAGDGDGEAGEPRRGGTLRIVGEGDVDHLDTAAAYYTVTYMLQRGYTRQLVQYPADEDFTQANRIAADVATTVPTKDNGGISADGRTYTLTIRPGVRWDTSPPRPVTAQDFVRGFKRLCNPVAGVGAPGYYTDTIVGMKAYCDRMLKIDDTAAAIREYIEDNEVEGLQAPDARTVKITLLRPTSDFLNILAMPFSSAAPEEYLRYVPDSAEFRQNTISNGPYKITTYEANKRIVLERNPSWNAASDPLREAYVDRIEVTEGVNAQAVLQRLEAGTADMMWDTEVPTTRIPSLKGDDRFAVHPTGSTNPYVVFNLQSKANGSALSKVEVRRALSYAVNKVAISQIYGGPDVGTPLGQVLTPPIAGYKAFDPYATLENRGDPQKAKRLLAQAGYPNGLRLKMLYRTQSNHPKVAQSIQADFAKAGVTVELVPSTPQDFYSRYLRDPKVARRGVWDIAAPGWVPDWNGNAARTFFVPLFSRSGIGPGGTNYGGYSSGKVETLISQALQAADEQQAAELWHQADRAVMADAPFIPLRNEKKPTFHSAQVQNFIYSPFSQQGDITHVWLSG